MCGHVNKRLQMQVLYGFRRVRCDDDVQMDFAAIVDDRGYQAKCHCKALYLACTRIIYALQLGR